MPCRGQIRRYFDTILLYLSLISGSISSPVAGGGRRWGAYHARLGVGKQTKRRTNVTGGGSGSPAAWMCLKFFLIFVLGPPPSLPRGVPGEGPDCHFPKDIGSLSFFPEMCDCLALVSPSLQKTTWPRNHFGILARRSGSRGQAWPGNDRKQTKAETIVLVVWPWYPKPPENHLAQKPLRDPSEPRVLIGF
jgi:hypothetical protein